VPGASTITNVREKMTEDPTPYLGNPGDMIRYIRKSKRITIVELAEKMGVGQDYIARLEMGEVRATQEQIEVIRSFIE